MLVGLTLFASAQAKPKKKGKDAQVEEAAPAPPPPPALPPQHPLPFSEVLPIDLGVLANGLANPSAQGCAACHTEPTSQWQQSGHHGSVPPSLKEATTLLGMPQCLNCHQPALQQHERLASDQGDGSFSFTANEQWSATLSQEGVTCVTCHLRDGKILGATPPNPSPHDASWNENLASAEQCASCHQLEWPGLATPLYDTYGEWSRSPWAAADVSCTDCHMMSGQGQVTHNVHLPTSRGLSLMVAFPSSTLRRGADPIDVSITAQNTGAGHHLPSGSPWTGLRMTVRLVRGEEVKALFETDWHRPIDTSDVWTLTEDTRLASGETRTYTVPLEVPSRAARGPRRLLVEVWETLHGEIVGTPQVSQEFSLSVE